MGETRWFVVLWSFVPSSGFTALLFFVLFFGKIR